MKMLPAWDSLENENLYLKFFICALFLVLIFTGLGLIASVHTPPLVIERGCTTKVASSSHAPPTEAELKNFVELAIHARFDSKSEDPSFLSADQAAYRAIEQKDLENQKMRQTMVINDITIKDGSVFTDCDRLIAVGNIRSTFRFPVKVEVEQVQRTALNPYGLILKRAEPLTSEVKK